MSWNRKNTPTYRKLWGLNFGTYRITRYRIHRLYATSLTHTKKGGRQASQTHFCKCECRNYGIWGEWGNTTKQKFAGRNLLISFKIVINFPPFQAVDQWHYVIAEQLAANAVPMLLLANKNDNGKLAIGAEVLDEVSDDSRPRLC